MAFCKEMNALTNLYKEHHDKLISTRELFSDLDLQGPLLMDLNSYWRQSIKFHIVGQETNGCDGDYRDIESLLKPYRVFNMGERYYSSPFWNITRKLERMMAIDPYSCAWSNINRYDFEGGPPTAKIVERLIDLDFLVREEIDLIRPDVCIFYTNHKYDYRLKSIYEGLQFESIPGLRSKHFCKLIHPNLPLHTYRTPHPRTIRTQKWEFQFLAVMQDILPKLKEQNKSEQATPRKPSD